MPGHKPFALPIFAKMSLVTSDVTRLWPGMTGRLRAVMIHAAGVKSIVEVRPSGSYVKKYSQFSIL